MIDERRSFAADVRNPLLALPAVARIQELPLEVRIPLAELLREIAVDADRKAEAAWSKRKGPMAAYWRATSTYAKHAARVVVSPAERRRARRSTSAECGQLRLTMAPPAATINA